MTEICSANTNSTVLGVCNFLADKQTLLNFEVTKYNDSLKYNYGFFVNFMVTSVFGQLKHMCKLMCNKKVKMNVRIAWVLG